MSLMFLKKDLDKLVEFIKQEGQALNLTSDNLDQIKLETVANIRLTFPIHTNQLELIRRITKEVASYWSGN